MVQRANTTSDAPSATRMASLGGIGYQSAGYNKLFTQVCDVNFIQETKMTIYQCKYRWKRELWNPSLGRPQKMLNSSSAFLRLVSQNRIVEVPLFANLKNSQQMLEKSELYDFIFTFTSSAVINVFVVSVITIIWWWWLRQKNQD